MPRGIIELRDAGENQSNASCQKKRERERERERGRGERAREKGEGQNGWTVQTELDTIRKSILRRWYAVKIILVSAATRRKYRGRAGGDEREERMRDVAAAVWDAVRSGSQTQKQFVLA